MKVVSREDGAFEVSDGEKTVAGPFETNASAWRALDRLENEPISPAEKRADWVAQKILSSGLEPVYPKPQSKKDRKMKKAAKKAPRWVRDIAAAKFTPPSEKRKYRESLLGTFGAASEVRRIDPAEYLKSRS